MIVMDFDQTGPMTLEKDDDIGRPALLIAFGRKCPSQILRITKSNCRFWYAQRQLRPSDFSLRTVFQEEMDRQDS